MNRLIYILALFSIFALSSPLYAGISVCHENGKVTNFALRGNAIEGCEYYENGQNISEAQDTAIRTLLKTVPVRYLKMINGFPAEMSPQEKVDVDDAWAAEIQAKTLSDSRSGAKDSVDNLTPEGVRLRASLLVVLDRFNTLTDRIDAVEACIENAGSLGAAKTCLAGLSPIGTATASQMKNAIKSKIDGGFAD